MSDYPYTAMARVHALIQVLNPLVKRDPEQEVRGIAVPVLVAALTAARDALPDDPAVVAIVGAYAHDLETRQPVRCADALLVARQLDAALQDASAWIDR